MSGYDDLTVMGTAPKVMGTATEVKPTTAALAAALHKTDIPDEIVDGDHWADSEWCIDIENEWAAAILDALDSAGWRLTARDKTSPNESAIAILRADNATLLLDVADREEALVWARAAIVRQREEIATLRAALDGLVEAAGKTERQYDWCVSEPWRSLRAALVTAKEAGNG